MSGFLSRQWSLRGGGDYHRLVRQASLHFPEEEDHLRAPEVDLRRLAAGSKKAAKKGQREPRGSKKGGPAAGKDGRGMIHPMQTVLDARRMDKAMAKPEFVRYLAYVKEAGRWEGGSDHPAIFFD